jgi:hypothetical protein
LKRVPFEYSESQGVHGVLTGTAKFPSWDDCSSAERGLNSESKLDLNFRFTGLLALANGDSVRQAAVFGLLVRQDTLVFEKNSLRLVSKNISHRSSGISRTSRCCSRILTDDIRCETSRISSSSSVVYSLLFSLFSEIINNLGKEEVLTELGRLLVDPFRWIFNCY